MKKPLRSILMSHLTNDNETIDLGKVGKKFSLDGEKEIFSVEDGVVHVEHLGCEKTNRGDKPLYINSYLLSLNGGYGGIYLVKEGPVQRRTTQVEIYELKDDSNLYCIKCYQVYITEVDKSIEDFLKELPEMQL